MSHLSWRGITNARSPRPTQSMSLALVAVLLCAMMLAEPAVGVGHKSKKHGAHDGKDGSHSDGEGKKKTKIAPGVAAMIAKLGGKKSSSLPDLSTTGNEKRPVEGVKPPKNVFSGFKSKLKRSNSSPSLSSIEWGACAGFTSKSEASASASLIELDHTNVQRFADVEGSRIFAMKIDAATYNGLKGPEGVDLTLAWTSACASVTFSFGFESDGVVDMRWLLENAISFKPVSRELHKTVVLGRDSACLPKKAHGHLVVIAEVAAISTGKDKSKKKKKSKKDNQCDGKQPEFVLTKLQVRSSNIAASAGAAAASGISGGSSASPVG